MSDYIKNEFKGFVNELSTEICKKVLLEELKKINSSFDETEKNYKSLYFNYSSNINNIKDQLMQLKNNTKALELFINSIEKNNDKVDKALSLINGKHNKVIEDIIRQNNIFLTEYSNKIHVLNTEERNKFIYQLTLSLDKSCQKYTEKFKNSLNGINVEDVYENTITISDTLNLLKSQMQETSKITQELEANMTNKLNKTIQITNNILNNNNNKIDSLANEINNKFLDLNNNINQKNYIIIGLISFIILLCLGMITL